MRPVFADAIAKLEADQEETEKRVRVGAYKSKSRDQAIANMIKIAASLEFKQQVRKLEPMEEVDTPLEKGTS